MHVVGAGLAGLAAALSLSAAGRSVVVHEAAPAAGGRCRSYFDRSLGLTIDNGNHLLLSGNTAAMGYLREINAGDALGGPDAPVFPFVDLARGERWTLRLSVGRIPWWIMTPGRRVPGSRLRDYLPLLGLARAQDDRSVAALIPPSLLFERLIGPLAIAALNTPPDEGLARLLGAVVRETLMRSGADCIPRFPRVSLAAAFVDPAVATLDARGMEVRFGSRVSAVAPDGRGVTVDGEILPADAVVLAVPPWVAADLVPGLTVPNEFQAILNIHVRADADPGPAGLYGLLGGTAEWVFVKPGHVSATISAANRIVDRPAEEIADAVWADMKGALGLGGSIPAWRVVKEKRATFAATAAQEARRPSTRTQYAKLFLAGDWTATGLPATIEGAIRSGRRAAEMLLSECPIQ